MPKALVNGVNLYYEVTGDGFPLIWCHEFGGAFASWDPQVKFFAKRYKVITYNARGYPPSDVPTQPQAYSQELSVEDLRGLLRHLGIKEAYVGGFSMGGSVALNLAIADSAMVKALIVAGTGTGSEDTQRLSREADMAAVRIEREGLRAWAEEYAQGPSRVQLRRKDPKGWEEFRRDLLTHSPVGSALTLRGVQGKRPSIFSLEGALQKLTVPMLIIVGDEDDPCMESALFMKRHIPRSGLVIFPQSGHAVNLEEPDLFNRVVSDFLGAVEVNKWRERERGSGVGFMVEREAKGLSR